MRLTAIHTDLFSAREDLPAFIVRHIPHVQEGSILAVASKLLALWKGEAVPFQDEVQKEALIKRESEWALKTKLAWLTVKDGMVMTNAGIDESNTGGKLLLLPANCYGYAEQLRRELQKKWQVKKLGVVITDSMILPLRSGVIAGAVAYAGFNGVRDERGKKDLFGRPLKVTFVNIADSLATAAALEMGECAEARPLCMIEDARVNFVDTIVTNEIKYPMKDDLYAPLFKAAGYIEKGEK